MALSPRGRAPLVPMVKDWALILAHPPPSAAHLLCPCARPAPVPQHQTSRRPHCPAHANLRKPCRSAIAWVRLPCFQGTVQSLKPSSQPLSTSIQGAWWFLNLEGEPTVRPGYCAGPGIQLVLHLGHCAWHLPTHSLQRPCFPPRSALSDTARAQVKPLAW